MSMSTSTMAFLALLAVGLAKAAYIKDISEAFSLPMEGFSQSYRLPFKIRQRDMGRLGKIFVEDIFELITTNERVKASFDNFNFGVDREEGRARSNAVCRRIASEWGVVKRPNYPTRMKRTTIKLHTLEGGQPRIFEYFNMTDVTCSLFSDRSIKFKIIPAFFVERDDNIVKSFRYFFFLATTGVPGSRKPVHLLDIVGTSDPMKIFLVEDVFNIWYEGLLKTRMRRVLRDQRYASHFVNLAAYRADVSLTHLKAWVLAPKDTRARPPLVEDMDKTNNIPGTRRSANHSASPSTQHDPSIPGRILSSQSGSVILSDPTKHRTLSIPGSLSSQRGSVILSDPTKHRTLSIPGSLSSQRGSVILSDPTKHRTLSIPGSLSSQRGSVIAGDPTKHRGPSIPSNLASQNKSTLLSSHRPSIFGSSSGHRSKSSNSSANHELFIPPSSIELRNLDNMPVSSSLHHGLCVPYSQSSQLELIAESSPSTQLHLGLLGEWNIPNGAKKGTDQGPNTPGSRTSRSESIEPSSPSTHLHLGLPGEGNIRHCTNKKGRR